jgi:protein-disulfide isomerase-like protein with CxxC motif
VKAAEIDALKMVRSIRDRFYEETRNLTPAELMAYIARGAAAAAPVVETGSSRPAVEHRGMLRGMSTNVERDEPDRL